MTELKYDATLIIDDDYHEFFSEDACKELIMLQTEFVESYSKNADRYDDVNGWLEQELKSHLPDYDEKEIKQMTDEIVDTITVHEIKAEELEFAVKQGRNKVSWLAKELKTATAALSANETIKYLQDLDLALESANAGLSDTIQRNLANKNLDGFLAEKYHAETFNLNAKAAGSPYRAKVLEPNGSGYGKNSVDLVISDGTGKIVKRYQAKYYKTPKATENAFKAGDYRGQRKLVPDGQETNITAKTTTVIESPDGVKSNPLTKEHAKEMQKEAQSGKWNDLNWNEYQMKDLMFGMGKQVCNSALLGAAFGGGIEIATKYMNGEKIEVKDVAQAALSSGGEAGAKAALSGAIKVGVEKGIIKVIPKGTPAGTIASIVHVGVENAKVLKEMATGELTVKEGLDKMERVTVSTTAGLATMGKGAMIGASIGKVFGPVGVFVGGLVGGTVGYMAGSKVGETVVRGVQTARKKAREVVSTTVDHIKNTGSRIVSGISSIFSFI